MSLLENLFYFIFSVSSSIKVWNVNSELIQIKIMKIKQHLARLVPL